MYERILVPTDDSESMVPVYEHAIDIAARRDATVYVLYVIDDRAFLTLEEGIQDDVLAELQTEGESVTTAAADQFADAGVDVETVVRRGDPATEILDYAEETGIDLVAMGTRRTNYRESMLGSVSQKVIAAASMPVLTVNVANEA